MDGNKKNELTEQLYQLTTLAAGDFNLHEVLDRLTEAAVKILGVKACSLRLLNEQTGDMKMRSTYGLSEGYRNKGEVTKQDPVIKAAFEGQAVVLDDMRNDKRAKFPDAATKEGIVSQLTVAMNFQGKAIGVLRLYSPKPKHFSKNDINVAKAVASQCAVAITNARLISDAIQSRRMAEQVRLAGVIQRRMIPDKLPQVTNLDIAASYIPCFDVGGDFYDFIEISDNCFAVVIADVIGKGVPAAIMTSMFRGALRAYADDKSCTDPIIDVVHKLNKLACRECRVGEFVSIFYAIIDAGTKKITYCNCGHEPAVLIRDGEIEDLNKGGLVLGVDPTASYEVGKVQLKENDFLLFYTDGLIDAANYNKDMWGRENMLSAAKKFADGSAENMIKNILGYRRRFVGLAEQLDDTSVIVIKTK